MFLIKIKELLSLRIWKFFSPVLYKKIWVCSQSVFFSDWPIFFFLMWIALKNLIDVSLGNYMYIIWYFKDILSIVWKYGLAFLWRNKKKSKSSFFSVCIFWLRFGQVVELGWKSRSLNYCEIIIFTNSVMNKERKENEYWKDTEKEQRHQQWFNKQKF